MQDVLIIGGGPAGVSAAIYAVRSGLSVTVIAQDDSALTKTDIIENYYGFPQPVSGKNLLANGEKQARRLGVEWIDDEVIALGYAAGKLSVTCTKHTFDAKTIILATGADRTTPNIEGLRQLEGQGVSYCAVCDAFFYRNKPVAVLGTKEYALHEAAHLLPIASSVTLLTNGEPVVGTLPEGLSMDTRKIRAIVGEDTVQQVAFEQGDPLTISGVFVAIGVASSNALARKLGAITKSSRIVVDDTMSTNVPGLFAAGDCTGGLKQIVKAVHEGAVAGMSAAQYIRAKK